MPSLLSEPKNRFKRRRNAEKPTQNVLHVIGQNTSKFIHVSRGYGFTLVRYRVRPYRPVDIVKLNCKIRAETIVGE